MGGGLELCVFPEQSALSSSSPVPPEVSPGGVGDRGRLPRVCSAPSLQPPARQLPPVSARSQAADAAAFSMFLRLPGFQPAAPCPKRVGGVGRAVSGFSMHLPSGSQSKG